MLWPTLPCSTFWPVPKPQNMRVSDHITFTSFSFVSLSAKTFKTIVSWKAAASILTGIWRTIIQGMFYCGWKTNINNEDYIIGNSQGQIILDSVKESADSYRYNYSLYSSTVMDRCIQNQCLFLCTCLHFCRELCSNNLFLWQNGKGIEQYWNK